jgi:phage FluMu protein Com
MRSKYLKAPVGSIFGKWLVISYSHYNNEHYWNVRCLSCNNLFTRRAGQLVNKRSKGCQSCNSIEREKYSFWEGIDGISKQYLTKLTYRRKVLSLELKDLVDIWKAQQGRCALSGIQLSVVQKDSNWAESTASIDRIDSSKGYIKGNIQWVHKKLNMMKSNMTDQDFFNWCKLVVDYKGGSCGV